MAALSERSMSPRWAPTWLSRASWQALTMPVSPRRARARWHSPTPPTTMSGWPPSQAERSRWTRSPTAESRAGLAPRAMRRRISFSPTEGSCAIRAARLRPTAASRSQAATAASTSSRRARRWRSAASQRVRAIIWSRTAPARSSSPAPTRTPARRL